MSQHAINQYYAEIEKIVDFSGSKRESTIRTAFKNLLNEFAKPKGLMIVDEAWVKGTKGKNVKPDGILKDALRQDWGYWESKDEDDNIDDEIKKKFDKGYPKDNILFEDSMTVVLFQNGYEILRVSISEPYSLERIINIFIKYERPEIKDFREAIEHFKQDIPKVTQTLRRLITENEKTNAKFNTAGKSFLLMCQGSINPNITMEDVREMIIKIYLLKTSSTVFSVKPNSIERTTSPTN